MSKLVLPDPGVGPDATYDALLAQAQLGYQRCEGCRAAVFPPRHHCPDCGADALVWHASSGRGVVYSASVIAPRDADPYCVALVDLEDGYRMMSNVVGAPAGEVEIGQQVRVAIASTDAGRVPLFEVVR